MVSELTDEQIIFFKHVQPNGLRDKLIKLNKGKFFYFFLYKLGIK